MISQEWLDRCPCCSKVWVCWRCEGTDHQVWVRQECSGRSKLVLPAAQVCTCNPQLNDMHVHMLQGGLNGLLIAAIGNHEEVVRALVGEFGLSVNHRDNVSCTSMCRSYSVEVCVMPTVAWMVVIVPLHIWPKFSPFEWTPQMPYEWIAEQIICELPYTSIVEYKSGEECVWPHCVHVGISIQKACLIYLYIHTYLLYVLALCSSHLLIPSITTVSLVWLL